MSLWLQRRGLDGWGLTEERALLFVAERRAAGLKTWTSRSHRCLEVTPHLIGRLRTHKLASPISAQHDFVFAGRTGRGHDHRNIGGRVLARPVERAGLGSVHDDAGGVLSAAPTFHSLRHTHASALIAHGWDIEEVRARLGHSSVATTQRIYVHEFDAAGRSDERRNRLALLYGAEPRSAEDQTSVRPVVMRLGSPQTAE